MPAVITDNALTLLNTRYLDKGTGEDVDGMFRRVAGGDERYIKLMSELEFLPNSPTLFNAGLKNGCTLSACFVLDVEDTMFGSSSGIVETRAKAIAIAKAGGGVGYYFGHLRPKGSPIKSIHRMACGPVAVMRDYHQIHKLVTQGGKRDLAQMGVLPCYHHDISEFVHSKDADPQSLSSFNISVSWTDEWFSKIDDLTHPASKLWKEQVHSAWSHGCPGMLFHDAVNRANPNIHLGIIYATNPCGETPNRNGEPCNLGSINLWRFVNLKTREFNWDRLGDVAALSTEFLDDILDRNVFPHPDIIKAAHLTRKLGLGVMGWADTLALMGIHYDTQKAVDLGDRVMAFINKVARDRSEELAITKGPYAGYDTTKTQGSFSRNETVTSIAPTGTIAILANCFGSIEPHYSLEWDRVTNEGIKMKESIAVKQLLNGFVPKVASEVPMEWHVRHQAAFQRHTDLGVSKTINLPNKATEVDVAAAYRLMHELGCKGGTVFRDGCRSEQVLTKKGSSSVFTTGLKKNLPKKRPGFTYKFRVAGKSGFLTVGLFDDGTLAEIFLRFSKLGSTVGGMLDSWAITFSVALQEGVSLEALCGHHKNTRFDPAGITDDKDIPTCTSIPDYVVRLLEKEFLGKGVKAESADSGAYCPECGEEAIYIGGCLTCNSKCGWSKCG